MKYFISQPMNGKTDEEIKAKRKEVETAILEQEPGAEILDSFFEGAPHDAKPLWFLGKSLEILSNADIAYFCEYAKREEADAFVLGLPKNMDGTEGERAEKSRAFAAMLKEQTGLEVVLWDERRSSIEAHAILHAGGKKEKQHRKTVDAVAAALMLEGYLTRRRLEGGR